MVHEGDSWVKNGLSSPVNLHKFELILPNMLCHGTRKSSQIPLLSSVNLSIIQEKELERESG